MFHNGQIYKFLIRTNLYSLVGGFGVRVSMSRTEHSLTTNNSLSGQTAEQHILLRVNFVISSFRNKNGIQNNQQFG